MSDTPPPVLAGQHDRYTLLDPLSFDTPLSEVFGAVGLRRGPVVVKRARPLPEGRMQLERESELALACTSPLLVAAIERIEGQGGPWLVLERIIGPTLLDLAQAEPIPVPIVGWIVGRLALILARLHHDGLVHRDLKLENVLWETRHGHLKLIDLGLSLPVGQKPINLAITERSTAPEAKKGAAADPRQDLYALGVLTDLLLGGRSGVPDWLTTLTARLRAERPEDRPQTAMAVADEISERGLPAPAPPETATANPFPLSSVRCPRCRTAADSRFSRRCDACGTDLTVVLFLVRRPEPPSLRRIDVLGELSRELRDRLRAAVPLFAVRDGLELSAGELSGEIVERRCFEEWVPILGRGE